MAKLVAIKIDVTKIDKARLFQGKNGAQYLDATVFINEDEDQYGNHGMITQSVSKEERESGVRGEILGNVKTLGEFSGQGGGQSNTSSNKPSADFDDSDSIPF